MHAGQPDACRIRKSSLCAGFCVLDILFVVECVLLRVIGGVPVVDLTVVDLSAVALFLKTSSATLSVAKASW